MTKQRKKGSGGKREGAGRHLIYGEETDTVSFRVPMSRISHIKNLVKGLLEGWKIKAE